VSQPKGNARLRFLIHALCIATMAVTFFVVAQIVIGERDGHTPFGTPDYAGLYVAGVILDRGQPERLYDQDFQFALLHELLPGAAPDVRFPFGHAPVAAVLLRPLAALPFRWSYFLWLGLFPAIAVFGLALLRNGADAIPPADWKTTLFLTASFAPLTFECWIAGQLSILGFVAVAVALCCERHGRSFLCGTALGLCLYKPTLLLFALPILFLGGRWRLIAGIAAGAAAVALSSLAVAGWTGSASFLDMMAAYARHTSSGSEGFNSVKQVDLNSFVTMLLGGPTPIARWALIMSAVVAAAVLLPIFWTRRLSLDRRVLVLCATLTWNAVFNLYTPIYDLSLLVPNVIMTADVLYRRPQSAGWRPGPIFGVLVALAILVGACTQTIAAKYGFQPMTLVLIALGGYQAYLAAWGLQEQHASAHD
jgi:hypothetical protein